MKFLPGYVLNCVITHFQLFCKSYVTQLVCSGSSFPLSTLCRVYEKENVAYKEPGKRLKICMQRYALTCQKTLYEATADCYLLEVLEVLNDR